MSIIFPSPIDWSCKALSPLITAALILADGHRNSGVHSLCCSSIEVSVLGSWMVQSSISLVSVVEVAEIVDCLLGVLQVQGQSFWKGPDCCTQNTQNPGKSRLRSSLHVDKSAHLRNTEWQSDLLVELTVNYLFTKFKIHETQHIYIYKLRTVRGYIKACTFFYYRTADSKLVSWWTHLTTQEPLTDNRTCRWS